MKYKYFLTIAVFLAVLSPIFAKTTYAEIFYYQIGSTDVLTSGSVITSSEDVTFSSTSTVTDVGFYCSLSPFDGGGSAACEVRLVDVLNPSNVFVMGTFVAHDYPIITTDPPLLSTSTISVEVPPGTYHIKIPVQVSGNTVYSRGTPDGKAFLYLANNDPITDLTTRILAINPLGGSTVATSSAATVGATIQVNAAQWTNAISANNANWFVQLTIYPSNSIPTIPTAAGSFDSAFNTRVIKFPISASGPSTYSTTTPVLDTGMYTIDTQIIQPSPYNAFLTWFGFGSAKILAATSTQFTAVSQTGFDKLTSSSTDIISDFFASTSPKLISSCASFTGFDLGDCLNLLFIPQSGDLGRVMQDLNSSVFTYAPFGYFTRMITILSGQATTTFPMLEASFPDPSNPTEMMTYTFDQNEALSGAGALLDNLTIPQDPAVNVRDSMDLIVKTVIALSVMSYIFWDIAHSAKGGHQIKTKLS